MESIGHKEILQTTLNIVQKRIFNKITNRLKFKSLKFIQR